MRHSGQQGNAHDADQSCLTSCDRNSLRCRLVRRGRAVVVGNLLVMRLLSCCGRRVVEAGATRLEVRWKWTRS